MYNIGDKIVFVEEINDCDESVFTIGNVYEILDIDEDGYIVNNDNDRRWIIELDAFEPLKKKYKKPKNEIEFLDRVKQNFRNGV